jgi:hypothetical protein
VVVKDFSVVRGKRWKFEDLKGTGESARSFELQTGRIVTWRRVYMNVGDARSLMSLSW